LDTKSINFYLKFGFTPDGFTFIKNLRMLERNVMLDMHKHKFSKKKHRSSIKKVNLTINDSIDLFYKKLVNVHKEFLKRTPPENTLVTLSGGLDTRLNFALIHDKKRYKYSSFYTPPLNEKEDKDTLIASIFANKYGINLKIDKFQLINEKLAISYYKNQQDSTNVKVVTGLLGGEFLSNSFVRFIQNNVRDLYKKKSFEKAKHLFNQEDRMLLKMFKETDGFYQFMTTILYRSFFSNFYGGTEGYWSNPYKHILRYYSVFTEPDIVKTLWSIPEDYILYSNNKFQLLLYERYFKEYTKIGTNSKLKNITDYGFSYFEEGLEPKNNRINRSEHLYEIALNNLNKHKEIIINEHSNKQNIIDLNTWITFLDSLKK
ncbi:MAG: hypothetical protein KDE33_14700, partial [Bacteroidetes bacterium]|nr:hypothetical protein [Bacteroidota bacterium]